MVTHGAGAGGNFSSRKNRPFLQPPALSFRCGLEEHEGAPAHAELLGWLRKALPGTWLLVNKSLMVKNLGEGEQDFSNYSQPSHPLTSLLRSGRGSGCESASGLLESVCQQRQQLGVQLCPCSQCSPGNPVEEVAGEAKGSAGAIVQLLSHQMH